MLRISLRLLLAALIFLIGTDFAQAAGRKTDFVLVIDPGHGGHDAGAIGNFSKEKDINLDVALEFGRLVQANCPRVKVIYTRRTDVFIPLQTRADIANRNKADLFISVHTNSLPGGKIAYGAETYTLGMARAEANLEVAKRENSVIVYEKNYQQTYAGFDPNKTESYIIFELLQDKHMKQSVELARAIQQQYVSYAGRKNKGVHQAGFLVLRQTSMPAVLTELGFISTPAEERFLNSRNGIKKMGRSLYNGFRTYYDRHLALTGQAQAPSSPAADTADATPAGTSAATDGAKATPQQPADAPKPSGDAPKPSGDAPKPSGDAAKPSGDAPKPSGDAPKPSGDAPKSSGDTPKPSGDANAADSTETTSQAGTDGRPVFKVQVLAAAKQIRPDDPQFKGLSPIAAYRDNGLYKYTYGSSTDYEQTKQLRKDILDLFPDAFIVAFVNGQRTDLSEAIRQSKK